MKEKRRWWMISLIVLILLAAGFLSIRIGKGLWVRKLLTRAWEQEQMVCKIHMEMPEQIDGIVFAWDDVEDQRYFTVDLGAEQLYLHDEKLYFSNGTGYDLEELLEPLNIPEKLMRHFIYLMNWERTSNAGNTTWKFHIPEKPNDLISRFFPELIPYWDSIRSGMILLNEEGGHLKAVSIHNGAVHLYVELTGEEPKPIPTELMMLMGTSSLPDIRTLEPLIRACLDLNAQETVLGDVTIRVDCGPLPIQDTGKIRFSEEGLYWGRGDQWTELTPDSVERDDLLLGLCWMLIRDGIWEPDGTDSGTFTLTVPAENLKASLLSIISELENLDFRLEDGTITISIEENQLAGVELTSTGHMPFLITTIPLSIQIGLTVTG